MGEGGIVGCWPETETAIGCKDWLSGHRRYLAFLEQEVYSLIKRPIITKTRAISDMQIIIIINLVSCF